MKAILELEMPESCRDCILKQHDSEAGDYFCAGIENWTWIGKNVWDGGKHPDCPLKPVEEGSAKSCENCIYYKTHTVQGQLYRAWCELNQDDVEYGEGCVKFEPKRKEGGKG
jgi:hypothetical protein